MTEKFTRRTLLFSAAIAAAAAPPDTRLPIRKAVEFNMLPKGPILDAFTIARDAGFEEIECPTTPQQDRAEEMLAASRKTGLRIHSVMNEEHWRSPLSSVDPAVVEKSLEGMRTSLHNAHLWGSDTVLLVPAVVNPETRYADAWERSQRQIRKLIPLAAELKVIIAIEEVWNKFLLSPLEFAHYVDEFKSPWIKAYFDVGNVVIFGYPQDWIHTLGKRFRKVHLKDFKVLTNGFSPFQTQFVNLGDGDIDWPAVRKAFADVGYTGWTTVELDPGDEAYLRDVAKRVDKLVLGM